MVKRDKHSSQVFLMRDAYLYKVKVYLLYIYFLK